MTGATGALARELSLGHPFDQRDEDTVAKLWADATHARREGSDDLVQSLLVSRSVQMQLHIL
ncbi:MAG TPA: hypothetical protein VGG84_11795 [Gemmatimonadaceae bacterium]